MSDDGYPVRKKRKKKKRSLVEVAVLEFFRERHLHVIQTLETIEHFEGSYKADQVRAQVVRLIKEGAVKIVGLEEAGKLDRSGYPYPFDRIGITLTLYK